MCKIYHTTYYYIVIFCQISCHFLMIYIYNRQMIQMLTEKCTFQDNVITELQREAEYYQDVKTEFDMATTQIRTQRLDIYFYTSK
jgi:hypothetical protein